MTTAATATESLLPCPFCNSSALLKSYEDRDGARIQCACGAQGPIPDCQIAGTNHEAIAAWNRRAESPRCAKLEAALLDMLLRVERECDYEAWQNEIEAASALLANEGAKL